MATKSKELAKELNEKHLDIVSQVEIQLKYGQSNSI